MRLKDGFLLKVKFTDNATNEVRLYAFDVESNKFKRCGIGRTIKNYCGEVTTLEDFKQKISAPHDMIMYDDEDNIVFRQGLDF